MIPFQQYGQQFCHYHQAIQQFSWPGHKEAQGVSIPQPLYGHQTPTGYTTITIYINPDPLLGCPDSGDWMFGFGGMPVPLFLFMSTQQVMEGEKAREMRERDSDWIIGLDLVFHTGLLIIGVKRR